MVEIERRYIFSYERMGREGLGNLNSLRKAGFYKVHPNIKFTYETNKNKKTAFLDISVKLFKNSIATDLHVQSADRHQYLHFSSSHKDHTKRSIIKSQALIVNRTCSLISSLTLKR